MISRRNCVSLLGAAIALSALGGCGRKGPLEPHPDDTSQSPRGRAAITTPSPADPAARPQRRTLSSPIVPPKDKFFLDPIL